MVAWARAMFGASAVIFGCAPGDEGGGATSGATTGSAEASSDGPRGDIATYVCGDGVVEGAEICDDGMNNGSYGSCAADCEGPGPHCGDGLVTDAEHCDDGNAVDGDACNHLCTASGEVQWLWSQSQPNMGVVRGVAADDFGRVMAVGYSSYTFDNDLLPALVRTFSEDGDLLSAVDVDAGGRSWLFDVEFRDGVFVSTGGVLSYPGSGWIHRVDQNGQAEDWLIPPGAYFSADVNEIGVVAGSSSTLALIGHDGELKWQIDDVGFDDVAVRADGTITALTGEEAAWRGTLTTYDSTGALAGEPLVIDEFFPTVLDGLADGGLAVAGEVTAVDAALRRYDASNQLMWSVEISAMIPTSILDTAAGLVIGGLRDENDEQVPRLVRVSQAGEVVWDTTLELPAVYFGGGVTSLALDPEGAVIAGGLWAGGTFPPTNAATYPFVAKLSP